MIPIANPSTLTFTIVNTPELLEDAVTRIITDSFECSPVVALDTETYQRVQVATPYKFTDPHTWAVRLIQIKTVRSEPLVIDLSAFWDDPTSLELLRDLLTQEHIVWVAHHSKYELKMIFGTLGVWLPQVFDTLVAAKLLGFATGINAYKDRGMGLADLCRDFLGVEVDKTEQSSNWSGELTERQWIYAAKDVLYLHALYDIFYHALVHEYEMPQTMAQEMSILPYVAEIEYNGVGFDLELYKFIQACAEYHLPQLALELGEYFKVPMQETLDPVTLEFIKVPLINWDSNAQVLALFQNHGIEVEDLEYETIDEASKTWEILRVYLDYKSISKQRSTPLGNWVHPLTGRIHGELDTCGAATGRCAAKNPNIQQIPKIDIEIPTHMVDPVAHARFFDKKKGKYLVNYRYCFVPKPGNVLFSSDFSGQETALAAVLSMDKNLIEILCRPEKIQVERDGELVWVENPEADMHAINAHRAFGVAMANVRDKHPQIPGKSYRDLAKAITFGTIYGQSAAAFAKLWGVEKSFAEEIQSAFFSACPDLKRWLKRVGRLGEKTRLSRFGLDRLRFLNDSSHSDKGAIARAAGNTPVQGSGAQMIKVAIYNLGAALRRRLDGGILMYAVHDEVLVEAPIELAEAYNRLITDMMNAASHVFLKGIVPDRASCAFADHWTK